MTLKSILLIACCLLFGFTQRTQAQGEVQLPYDLFQSVGSTNSHIYTFNKVNGTYDKSEFIVYDLDGKQLNRIELVAKQGVTFLWAGSMGDKTVFSFEGAQGYEVLVVDKAGQEIGRKTLEVADKIRDIQIKANETGFTVLYEVKRKKTGVGLLVHRYDAALTPTWTYEKFSEEGKLFLHLAQLGSDGSTAVLIKKGNKELYALTLIGPDGQEKVGTDIYTRALNDYSPYFMRFLPSGELMVISDYGSTSTETFQGYPLGMQIHTFNTTDGKEMSAFTLPFLQVQQLVGDKWEGSDRPVYEIAPALRVLDVQYVDQQPRLVCESYTIGDRQESIPSTTAGMAPTIIYYRQVRLMDFYLIDPMKPETALHRIWRPTRIVEMETGSYVDHHGLCSILARNGLFSYQGYENGKLLVRGFGHMHNYLNTIPVASTYESTLNRMYFGKPLNCQPSQNPLMQSYAKGFGVYSLPRELAMEGLMKTGNAYTVYYYNPITNMLHFNKINFQ